MNINAEFTSSIQELLIFNWKEWPFGEAILACSTCSDKISIVLATLTPSSAHRQLTLQVFILRLNKLLALLTVMLVQQKTKPPWGTVLDLIKPQLSGFPGFGRQARRVRGSLEPWRQCLNKSETFLAPFVRANMHGIPGRTFLTIRGWGSFEIAYQKSRRIAVRDHVRHSPIYKLSA